MLPADLLGFHLYPLDQTQSGNLGLVPTHPFTHTYSRAAGIPAPGQASCFSPKKVPATFFNIMQPRCPYVWSSTDQVVAGRGTYEDTCHSSEV